MWAYLIIGEIINRNFLVCYKKINVNIGNNKFVLVI